MALGGQENNNVGDNIPPLKKGLFVEPVICGIGKCKVRYQSKWQKYNIIADFLNNFF